MKKTIKVVIIGIILISCIIIGVNAQKSVEKMEEKKIDSQINISEEIIPEEKVESEDDIIYLHSLHKRRVKF